MSTGKRSGQIRPAMVRWGILTLIYFLVTGIVVELIAQTQLQRVLGALIATLPYSTLAILILYRVVKRAEAYQQQLEASLVTQQKNEAELERRLHEEQLLNRVIATASSSLESTKILETVCEELAHALDVPQAGMALLNADRTHETVVAEFRTPNRPTALGIIIPLEGNLVTREVIETRQPIALMNAQSDPRQAILHELEKQRATASLLIVPLIVRDQVIGTLGLESATPREFTGAEIVLAQKVASAISPVLEAARLNTKLVEELDERKRAEENLRRRNAELDTLNITTIGMINRRDPQELLESIVARAAALMNSTHGFLFIPSSQKQTLTLHTGIGRFADHMGLELGRGNGAAGTVWETGEPLAVEHYPDWEPHTPGFEWIHSIICVPLRSHTKIAGVIGVAYTSAERALSVTDIELLDRFGRLASLALDNANLYNEAQKEIAERRRTQEQLQMTVGEIERAQTKARAILDATTDSMLLITPQETIIAVNWSFCRNFFGKHPREVVGHTLQDYQKEFEQVFQDPAEFQQLIRNSIQDAEQYSTNIIVQATPRRRELQIVSTPVRTSTNEFVGRLYVFHDVTKEREVDRLRTEFLSMVSHEMRTPLTSIKGYVDLLQTNAVGPVNNDQREFLDIIKTNTDRLVNLITDLLDLSRIEAGHLELKQESVDLGLLIRQVVNTLRPIIDAKQQHIAFDIASNATLAYVDKDRVNQILTNLISNSSKYSPVNGHIAIAAHPENLQQIRVDIKDDGIGISDKDQAQLFSRFYRTNNPVTQEIDGTGLGLVITRSLVELHGGRISVTSTLGQGSTFSFTLPTEASRTHPPSATTQRCILLVDAERSATELTRHPLERAGYQVLAAHNGDEAITLARTAHPDLIALGLLLSDSTGYQVIDKLKSDASVKFIPIMILSILAESEEGKIPGVIDYLAKPFNEQTLLEHVERIFQSNYPRTILVGQAEAHSHNLLGKLLRRAGYDVLEAHGGVDAVRLAKENHPDLVLLDLKMPELNGIDAVRALRADETMKNSSVIIMAGYEGITDIERSTVADLKVASILTKPITAEKLATAIYQTIHAERENHLNKEITK